MALSKTDLKNQLRNTFIEKVAAFLAENGEDVLRTNSNEIAIPTVDAEGNDEYLVLTFKIPTGSRDDGEPYDAYAEAESYRIKCEQKAEAEKKKAEAKAKKIERDKVAREAKKAAKEKAKAEAEG